MKLSERLAKLTEAEWKKVKAEFIKLEASEPYGFQIDNKLLIRWLGSVEPGGKKNESTKT